MGISDRSMAWKVGRLYMPLRTFQGLDNADTSTQSLSEGTPTVEPITTSEIVGLPMTTADEIAHIHAIPWDLDRLEKVFGRIYFQHAAAGADTPGFIWTSAFFAKQAAMTEFIANADKSTTFAAHTCSTNNPSLEVTVWTDLSWESYLTATDIMFAISIELNALGSASADECKLLGAEIMYTRDACTLAHKEISGEVSTSLV